MTNKSKSRSETQWIKLFKTTYYYWRHWCKQILLDGGIKKSRFIKSEKDYSGTIKVDEHELSKAKQVLQEYKKQNPDIVDMWW